MTLELVNYVKAPVEVTATRFVGGEQNALEIVEWINSNNGLAVYYPAAEPWQSEDKSQGHGGWAEYIENHGEFSATQIAREGDYIVRGLAGEFYVQSEAIFVQNYQFPGTPVQTAVDPLVDPTPEPPQYNTDGSLMSDEDIARRRSFFTEPHVVEDPILDELNANLKKEDQ